MKTPGQIVCITKPYAALQKAFLWAFILILILQTSTSFAAVFYSKASGNWNAQRTWTTTACGSMDNSVQYPVEGDTVYICAGHTIVLGASARCAELFVDGVLQLGNRNISVTGGTYISGVVTDNSAAGNNIFNDLIIFPGGTLNNTIGSAFTITGDISNQGVFVAGTGTFTFSGVDKYFSGTIKIAKAAINGTYFNKGTLCVGITLSGSGALTMGHNSMLFIGGAVTINSLQASLHSNTVVYTGASGQQVVMGTIYHHLIIDNDGYVATLKGKAWVNTDLTVSSGTFRLSNTPGCRLTVAGEFNVNPAAAFIAPENYEDMHLLNVADNSGY
jgi:hypothetical protein